MIYYNVSTDTVKAVFLLDIRVLQYFLAVAREESITKAAESLRMAQPPFEAVKRPGRRVGETESISFLVQAAQDLRKKHPLIVATYDLIYNAAQFAGKGFGYVITLDRLINTAGDSNLCF